jgi:hypothetical protein
MMTRLPVRLELQMSQSLWADCRPSNAVNTSSSVNVYDIVGILPAWRQVQEIELTCSRQASDVVP